MQIIESLDIPKVNWNAKLAKFYSNLGHKQNCSRVQCASALTALPNFVMELNSIPCNSE